MGKPYTNKKERRKLNPALKFILSFIVILIISGFSYAYVTASQIDKMESFLEFITTITGGAASLFSEEVQYYNKIIIYKSFSVEIIDECTGLLEIIIYLSAVLAFSTTIKNKLVGIAIGIPTIFIFNIIRIFVLLFIGANSKSLFDFMHLYFWQATLILMIGTIWIGWLYLVVFREKRSADISN